MQLIKTPDSSAFEPLCQYLQELGSDLDPPGSWPAEQLAACGRAGVFRWFHSPQWGGLEWSQKEVVEGYLNLSAACLTTTFVITQRTGACQRIERSENEALKAELLPALLSGESFATVGISHLTTSRQHLNQPALQSRRVPGGFELDGFSPWVTGVPHADHVVIGATVDDGQQILAALPTHLKGVSVPPTPELVGLSASRTGRLDCQKVFLDDHYLLYGPHEIGGWRKYRRPSNFDPCPGTRSRSDPVFATASRSSRTAHRTSIGSPGGLAKMHGASFGYGRRKNAV